MASWLPALYLISNASTSSVDSICIPKCPLRIAVTSPLIHSTRSSSWILKHLLTHPSPSTLGHLESLLQAEVGVLSSMYKSGDIANQKKHDCPLPWAIRITSTLFLLFQRPCMIWPGSQIPGPAVATLAFAGSRIFHAHSHLRVLVLTVSVVQNILPHNLLWLSPSHSSALCSRVILEGPALTTLSKKSHLSSLWLFQVFPKYLHLTSYCKFIYRFFCFCCLLPTLECSAMGVGFCLIHCSISST